MSTQLRNFALWVFVVLLLLALFALFQNPSRRPAGQEISFSQFITEVEQGRVRDVTIQGPEIHGNFTDGRDFQTYAPNDPTLTPRLLSKRVTVTARPQQNDAPWFIALFVSWLPFLVLMGVLIYLARSIKQATSVGEVAALKRQIEDLRQEIERLKGG
jgi:cell division protease FtsH